MKTLRSTHLLPLLILSCFAVASVRGSETRNIYPEIDYSSQPSYIPNNVIALSFDDGPDWDNTAKVLDALKLKQQKATFFINTNNWANVNTDAPIQALVRRIVAEGHELGSHTVSHPHLSNLTAAQIEKELAGVENAVHGVVGLPDQRITLFRAPYGDPYDPEGPAKDYNFVAAIVARHYVHIGWAIDSSDYECPNGDTKCVIANVLNAVKIPGFGDYGIILMHCVYKHTAAALPLLIDYFRNNGFQLWTVEDIVRARYGLSSEQIIFGNSTTATPTRPPTTKTLV